MEDILPGLQESEGGHMVKVEYRIKEASKDLEWRGSIDDQPRGQLTPMVCSIFTTGAYPGFREGGFHLHMHGIYIIL